MLRVISWNCRSAFLRKWPVLLSLSPDVAVIQEVTKRDLSTMVAKTKDFDSEWIGIPGKKGLAVIGLNGWKVRRLGSSRTRSRFFLPVELKRSAFKFSLIGVWAMAHKTSHENGYIGQVFNFASSQAALFNKKTMLMGDFNANAIWDSSYRQKTFSTVSSMLAALGQASVYHMDTGHKFGSEKAATFYLYGHIKRPYHIDYCFAGEHWQSRLKRVTIKNSPAWGRLSDHRPLVCEFSH